MARIDMEHVADRITVWQTAETLVSGVVSRHGLEPYNGGGNFLVPGYRSTKVDQHLTHIKETAEWLLEGVEVDRRTDDD